MKDKTEVVEALLMAAQLRERFGRMVPTSQAAAELERQHARIVELEAQLAAAHPVFSHMEFRAEGSMGAGRAVAVDTAGREMPAYNPLAAQAKQGEQANG